MGGGGGRGEWVGGAGVCFLFPILPGTECEEEGLRSRPRPPTGRTKERKNDLHERMKEKIKGKKD